MELKRQPQVALVPARFIHSYLYLVRPNRLFEVSDYQ